ncbi:MAG: hypothetical protein LBL59_04360 [Xanthomonadaceae bacterium]|jgi:hypothetical protein|nr:hypothetical protein [Xanthomonadaceae bacterium]
MTRNRRTRLLYTLIPILFFLLGTSPAIAGNTPSFDQIIEQIETSPEFSRVLEDGEEQSTTQQLNITLTGQLAGRYDIQEECFFITHYPQWVMVKAGADERIRTNMKGKMIEASLGSESVNYAIWRIGFWNPRYIAVAMPTGAYSSRGRIYGYFELKRK